MNEKDIKVLETVCICRKFDGIFTTNEVIFKAIENLIKEYENFKKENEKLKKCHLKYEEITGIDLLLEE